MRIYRIIRHAITTSFPGLLCKDERREEKDLVWAGQFWILIGNTMHIV